MCILLQIHVAANVAEGSAASSFQSEEPYHFAVDWCWYLSALVPAYCAAWYLMHTLVKAVEHQFFTSRQVLYFVIGIRVRHASCPAALSPTQADRAAHSQEGFALTKVHTTWYESP